MISKPLLVDKISASLNTHPYTIYLENLGGKRSAHLDIGAGTGQNVLFTEALGLYAVALEYDPDYISRIRSDKVVRGVADKIPFQSNSFDAISLIHVLEHLPAYQETLAEIYRILKPAGYLFIEVPNKYSLQELFNYLYTEYFVTNRNKHLGHCNFFYHRNLKSLLEQNNFDILDTRVVGGPLSSTYEAIVINFLRVLLKLVSRGSTSSRDYEFIHHCEHRLQLKPLTIVDQKINQHTYRFVKFFGFVCKVNKPV